MGSSSPIFATWSNVVETFRSHVSHYVEHGGGENALVGLRAEGAVTLQYAGRVIYELFQNALDRACSRAIVQFEDGTLLVGNDGDGILVDPGYDYSQPIEGEGRSDFHAMCALHTSNKSADRQFGNKGIGFRSVFGVSDSVQLWSRCTDGGWWGMELKQRLVPSEWPGSRLPELDNVILTLGGSRDRASTSLGCYATKMIRPADVMASALSSSLLLKIKTTSDRLTTKLSAYKTRVSSLLGFAAPGSPSTSTEQKLPPTQDGLSFLRTDTTEASKTSRSSPGKPSIQ